MKRKFSDVYKKDARETKKGPAVDWKKLGGSHTWPRPPLPPDFKSHDIHFQMADIDYYVVNKKQGAIFGQTPIVRLFGTTDTGHSICVHVSGNHPYIWIPVPKSHHQDPQTFAQQLGIELEQRIQRMPLKVRRKVKPRPPYVERVEVHQRCGLVGYKEPDNDGKIDKPFCKIILSIPEVVYACREILNTCITVGGQDMRFTTYESNVLFALRFMVDMKITGECWITLPKGKYAVNKQVGSRCQLDVSIPCASLNVHPNEGEWSKIGPKRIASFDIECKGQKGHFPTAETDPVIMIATVLQCSDGQGKHTRFAVVFATGSYEPLAQLEEKMPCVIYGCRTESIMLMAWRQFILVTDPDIFTGYNIINFDLCFLIRRAEVLGLSDFAELGRLFDNAWICKQSMESRAYGKQESKRVIISGRTIMDPILFLFREHKLRSFSLNAVANHFLGKQKKDVHHSQIAVLYEGSAADRTVLADYCLHDALLPLYLLEKLKLVLSLIEMARVAGVPVVYLIEKGQQIKVYSGILRWAQMLGYVIPHQIRVKKEKYKGATVFKVEPGYYRVHVPTLDFTSLYPTIMIAYNLCYSTKLTAEQRKRMNPNDYWTSPDGRCAFVKAHIRKGLLPQLLEFLLNARGLAKKAKAIAVGFMKEVFEQRQKSIKISSNSVYGFTAADMLNDWEIADTVTGFGRKSIAKITYITETVFKADSKFHIDRRQDATLVLRSAAGAKTMDLKTAAHGRLQKRESAVQNDKNPKDGKDAKIDNKAEKHGATITSEYDFVTEVGTRDQILAYVRTKDAALYARLTFVLENYIHVDAVVVYGDTDSAFPNFGTTVMEQTFEISRVACGVCNLYFLAPMSLAFEKVCCPLLMQAPKRYASLIYTEDTGTQKWAKIDVKGMENVRRSSSPFCNDMVQQTLEHLLISMSPEKAIDNVVTNVDLLLRNEIDISRLILSRGYNKTKSVAKSIHVEFAKKMAARDPAQAPRVGDRLSYIVRKGTKKEELNQRGEDPMYAIEHDIPLDLEHYRDELVAPISKLLQFVMPNPESLFYGKHAQTRIKTDAANGPLVQFTKKQGVCYGCKTRIDGAQILCRQCKPNAPLHYVDLMTNVQETEQKAFRMWSYCVDCTNDRLVNTAHRYEAVDLKQLQNGAKVDQTKDGKYDQDVKTLCQGFRTKPNQKTGPELCANNDCPIFYARRTVLQKLGVLRTKADMFELF